VLDSPDARSSRRAWSPQAAQPLAVGQQQPATLQRPASEVGAEDLVETARGLLGVLGELRPCVPQAHGDAGARGVAGRGLHLFHACARFVDPVCT